MLTTCYLVTTYGVKIESQPFTADMITTYGLVPGLALNGLIHMMLIAVLYGFKQRGLLKVAASLTALFPIINTVTIITEILRRV